MADVELQKRLRPLRRSPPTAADPEAAAAGGASPLPPPGNKKGKAAAAAAAAASKKASPSFFSVLALCDPIDALLLFVGCLGAVANGAALPLFSLAFGSMVDVLGPAATAGGLRSEVERVAGYFQILAAGALKTERRRGGEKERKREGEKERRRKGEGEREREGGREGPVLGETFSTSSSLLTRRATVSPFFFSFFFLLSQKKQARSSPRTSRSRPAPPGARA
jgi:hypothetical protein